MVSLPVWRKTPELIGTRTACLSACPRGLRPPLLLCCLWRLRDKSSSVGFKNIRIVASCVLTTFYEPAYSTVQQGQLHSHRRAFARPKVVVGVWPLSSTFTTHSIRTPTLLGPLTDHSRPTEVLLPLFFAGV